MLLEKNIETAYLISKRLDREGKKLVVKADSPLVPIMNFITLPDVHENPTMESHELANKIVEGANTFDVGSTTAYDKTMDMTVASLAPMLSEFLSITRNEIRPRVINLVKATSDIVTEYKEKASYNVTIKHNYYPSILDNSDFRALVERHKGMEPNDRLFPARPVLPALTDEQIHEILFRIPSLEKDVSDWITNLDLQEMYRKIFRQGGIQQPMSEVLSPGVGQLDYAIFGFIIAGILKDNPLPDTVGTPEEYSSGMTQIREQAAFAISSYINQMEAQQKSGVMVLGKTGSVSKPVLNVNATVYQNWIKDGGDVEALYGAAFHSKTLRTVNDFNDHKEELINLWNKQKSVTDASMGDYFFSKIKESLVIAFSTELANNPSGNGVNDETAVEEFTKLLSALSVGDIVCDEDKLSETICKLVCRSKYPEFGAENFLLSISKFMETNSNIHPREAALLATVEYVANWLVKDIVVVKG